MILLNLSSSESGDKIYVNAFYHLRIWSVLESMPKNAINLADATN